MKYLYPAYFEEDESEKSYSVKFPDLQGCITGGFTREEAYEMAADVLKLCITDLYNDGVTVPKPSRIEDLGAPEHGFTSYVMADVEIMQRAG